MARVRLVAGNWKMHGSRASNAALLDALAEKASVAVAVAAMRNLFMGLPLVEIAPGSLR